MSRRHLFPGEQHGVDGGRVALAARVVDDLRDVAPRDQVDEQWRENGDGADHRRRRQERSVRPLRRRQLLFAGKKKYKNIFSKNKIHESDLGAFLPSKGGEL